jgi:formylglycine-generating enzyme required for sulfatase activity/cytochrome c2
MVVIPAGSFEMGSTKEEQEFTGVPKVFADEESPRHPVSIPKAFAMARTLLTRGAYAAFVKETGHKGPKQGCGAHDAKLDSWNDNVNVTWDKPGFDQTDEHPVVCVNFLDATAYAEWLSKKTGKHYRIPNEAEWEYAARGGTATARYWGNSPEFICEKANIMTRATFEKLGAPDSWNDKLLCSGDHSFTTPVARYDPNPWGLYDMIGNVWEWVIDCAHNTYEGAPADGSAWTEPNCHKRSLRGGAFHSGFYFTRVAAREVGLDDTHAGVGLGFRLARDLDGAALNIVPPPPPRPVVGDPVKGEAQFGICGKCHSADAGKPDGIGPNLRGVFGKRAGTNRPEFAYSTVLKESGILWTEDNLDEFLKNPAEMLPHSLMSFMGVSNAQTRANIVAYLKKASETAKH